MDVISRHCSLVRIHIEHLIHCDALPSLIRYSKINWQSNDFPKAERKFTPYNVTLFTTRHRAMNQKENKKIIRQTTNSAISVEQFRK